MNIVSLARRVFGKQLNTEQSEMLFYCPKCKRPKLYCNPRKLTYYCVRCEYTGRLLSLAGEFDYEAPAEDEPDPILVPPTLEQIDAHPLYSPDLIEYLLKRGFTQQQIREIGVCESKFFGEVYLSLIDELGDVVDAEAKWIPSLAGAVIFPIYDNGYRGYQARYVYAKGKELRWRTAPGVHRKELLFNADTAFRPTNDRVYVAEGIPAACAFWPNGIATFGKGFSNTQLNRICTSPQRQIYVAYDGDAQDKSHELGTRLADVGKDVRIVEFGYVTPEVAEDPDTVPNLPERIERAVLPAPPSVEATDLYRLYRERNNPSAIPRSRRRYPQRPQSQATSYPWQRHS